MRNAEYFNNIKSVALSSCYWCEWTIRYLNTYDRYAPMVTDGLFNMFFKPTDVVGTPEIEKRLGRRLLVEELDAVPLSVPYLLSGHPIITESDAERLRLQEFEQLINERIRKQENRTRTRIRKTL